MTQEELKQNALDAHKETCHFFAKGKCQSPAMDNKQCDGGCRYMSDFKTKLGLRKLNLNIIGSICTNIAAKRGKIKILSSDAEDYETKKAAEAQIKYIGGELTELKRAYELFGKSEHLPKYSNVEEEAADVIICTLVLLDNVCHTEDIGRLITDKMKFNDQRED